MKITPSRTRRILSHNALSSDNVCRSCLQRLTALTLSRHASTAAAAVSSEETSARDPPIPPVTSSAPRKAFRLLCSPVVSRPPLLTRSLTPFEKAFYLYQKRLNERLALPFTRYFYFKKGTPTDVEWKRKAKLRKTPARDVGQYNAYADDGWHDEVLVGSKLGEPDDVMEKLLQDAEGKDTVDALPQGDAETGGEAVSGDAKLGEGIRKPVGEETLMEKPMPRITEADRQNDRKSLNRKLDRSLYLLVRNQDGRWKFPSDRVYGKESLHVAAERILLQAGGINMNTWIVGNHPIGHFAFPFRTPVVTQIPPNRLVSNTAEQEFEQEEFGAKTFFMKARIMAGQADLTQNELGDQAFEWLAKEEIQEAVTPQYWRSVKNMLTER